MVIQEIPTRISPATPTVNFINCHDDDVNRQPHHTCPHLYPTETKNNSTPQLISPQPATDDYLDHTLSKINQMVQSWQSAIAINQDPCDIICTALHHPSAALHLKPSLSMMNPLIMDPPLTKLTPKLSSCVDHWLITITVTNPSPITSAGCESCTSSSPSQTETTSPQTILTTLATQMLLVADCPAPTTTSRFVEPPQHAMATSRYDSIDPSLLVTVHSLGNFLIKYPRPTNATDDHDCYQLSPGCQVSLSHHDLLVQQMQVLCTINVILGKLCAETSQFLDTLSCPTPPSIAITLPLQLQPRTWHHPAIPALHLPAKNNHPSQQLIPAKPPFKFKQ